MDIDNYVSSAVITAVAEREGVDPIELNQPLYDVIDPDALDALFQIESGVFSFVYYGYRVTVDYSGTVSLDEYGC